MCVKIKEARLAHAEKFKRELLWVNRLLPYYVGIFRYMATKCVILADLNLYYFNFSYSPDGKKMYVSLWNILFVNISTKIYCYCTYKCIYVICAFIDINNKAT